MPVINDYLIQVAMIDLSLPFRLSCGHIFAYFSVIMQKREFTELDDLRLVYRGNKILWDLFSKSVHSIRQISSNESAAKGFYRFFYRMTG
jgi:hypothetical protein